MKRLLSLCLCLLLTASLTLAKKTSDGKSRVPRYAGIEISPGVNDRQMYPVQRASAQGVTTYLAFFTFDDAGCGCVCDAQGWTSVDLTAQAGDFFHVTDFTTPPEDCGPGDFGGLVVPQGAQALWCGLCPTTSDPYCQYNALPGYGNVWDQAFCSPCVFTADTMVTIDYYVTWDSEAGFDYSYLEWDACDGVYTAEPSVNGGQGHYDNYGSLFESINIDVTGPFSLRFHFVSDGAWSDEDGLWDSDGAIIIDSLTVRDGSGILVATETFEDEALGSTTATDWTSCTTPGYGDLAELTRAVPDTYQNNPVQEDPCYQDFTCLWTFYKNSTYNYACNTPNPSPQQMVVPYGNSDGLYAATTIRSPWIPLTGSGTSVTLAFDIYRDLKTDALVMYNWAVRSKIGATGCPYGFQDRGSGYFGDSKDWFHSVSEIGDLVRAGATHIQVAFYVTDYCGVWCGLLGSGNCHSHGPLIDNVEIYRVRATGPQISLRDMDMFQDTFSHDTSITSPGRADMAQDILSSYSPGIIPGDSAIISVNDPEVGLGTDPTAGGPAIYCFLSVDPSQYPSTQVQAPEYRSGAGYPGDVRFPYVGTVSAAGRTWDYFRMDTSFTRNGGLVAGRYCIDFNDNLFLPGDTCWFFFGAKNSTGSWSYASLPYGQSHSMNLVAGAPDEFTILPAAGLAPENRILYVDGFNFRGAQPFFDTAFGNLNMLDKIDRYDVRAPSYGVGNRLASRVNTVPSQLIAPYRVIIWNTGDLSNGCISDGSWDKSDDAYLLYLFLNNHTYPYAGVYLSGDDIADDFASLTSPSAVSLRTFINYTVVASDHKAAGAGVNPAVVSAAGSDLGALPDSFIVYGGCPVLNDFDVLAAFPPTSYVKMEYAVYNCPQSGNPPGPRVGGAVVGQTTTNFQTNDVRVLLAGFSYHEIRDIDDDGLADRIEHLDDIFTWFNTVTPGPIAARPNPRVNSLAQNYPNPFNPVTTIKYSLRERAHVSLKVYNVAGQLVRTLVDDIQSPEAVTPVEWRGLNNQGQQVSSGVYFYKLVTKGFTQTKKMVLLK